MTTAIVFTCSHARPDTDNNRFLWLGELIYDIKPDMVIDLGDGADMQSLNSFDDKYPKQVVRQSYEADIKSYLDAQEKLRHRFVKNKKKLPTWVGFEGNHEHRIKRAVEYEPRLAGKDYGISFGHLQTSDFFDEYHEYKHSAPSIADYDGVSYAHYFSSGSYGKPFSGLHHAYSLIQSRHHSSTCGHSHKRSVYFNDASHPRPVIGLVAGCYKEHPDDWAGQSNNEWWSGVIIKRNISNGVYDPEFVSLQRLKEEYGE